MPRCQIKSNRRRKFKFSAGGTGFVSLLFLFLHRARTKNVGRRKTNQPRGTRSSAITFPTIKRRRRRKERRIDWSCWEWMNCWWGWDRVAAEPPRANAPTSREGWEGGHETRWNIHDEAVGRDVIGSGTGRRSCRVSRCHWSRRHCDRPQQHTGKHVYSAVTRLARLSRIKSRLYNAVSYRTSVIHTQTGPAIGSRSCRRIIQSRIHHDSTMWQLSLVHFFVHVSVWPLCLLLLLLLLCCCWNAATFGHFVTCSAIHRCRFCLASHPVLSLWQVLQSLPMAGPIYAREREKMAEVIRRGPMSFH